MKLIKCHGNGYRERGDKMHRYKGENRPVRVKLEWGRVRKREGKEINKRPLEKDMEIYYTLISQAYTHTERDTNTHIERRIERGTELKWRYSGTEKQGSYWTPEGNK